MRRGTIFTAMQGIHLGIALLALLAAGPAAAAAKVIATPADPYSAFESAKVVHDIRADCFLSGDYHVTASTDKPAGKSLTFALTVEVFGSTSVRGLGDLKLRGGFALADSRPARDVRVEGCSAYGCRYTAFAVYDLSAAEAEAIGQSGLDAKIDAGGCDALVAVPAEDITALRSWAARR